MLSLGLIFFRTLNEGCHIHRRKNIIDRVFLHLQELLDNLFWSISVSWKMNDTILQMDIALFYVYIIYNFYISILYLNSNWMYRLWWRFETPAFLVKQSILKSIFFKISHKWQNVFSMSCKKTAKKYFSEFSHPGKSVLLGLIDWPFCNWLGFNETWSEMHEMGYRKFRKRIGANLFLENVPIHLGQEKENKTTVN